MSNRCVLVENRPLTHRQWAVLWLIEFNLVSVSWRSFIGIGDTLKVQHDGKDITSIVKALLAKKLVVASRGKAELHITARGRNRL